MKAKTKVVYSLLLAVFLVLITIGYRNARAPGQYDSFAKCLTSKGVLMYGAYWCPHCAEQKQEFGKSFQYVNYIECALRSDPNQQTQICEQRNIKNYPTWEINGSRNEGVYDLQTLSEMTGCALQ